MDKTINKLIEIKETLTILKNWSAVMLINEVLEVAHDERKILEEKDKMFLQLP